LDAVRSRRDVLAAARPRRTARLLAARPLRPARRRRALLRGREVPGPGLQGDDPDLPRALPVGAGDPAVRGLRDPEVRGVDAEPEPAVRDPALQLQVPPRLRRAGRRAVRRARRPARGGRALAGFHGRLRGDAAQWRSRAAAAPARRPAQRDLSRSCRARARPPPARSVRHVPRQRGSRRLRSLHPLQDSRHDRRARLPARHDRARPDRVRGGRTGGRADRRGVGGPPQLVAKHTLRNAAVPIVTITGLQFGALLGGAVVTETVFAWPGMGRLAIQSIYNRDYPVVQCVVFISAALFVVINFAVDMLYGVLDPRIRAR